MAQVVDRLGAKAVGQLDDTERSAKLDAAVAASGWRELRTADDAGGPWASAVEVAIVAEELGKGVADTAFVGPTLAAELRRLTGTEASSPAETVGLTADLVALGSSVAVDAAGATGVLVLHDGGLVEAAPGAALPETDLTRPSLEVGAGRRHLCRSRPTSRPESPPSASPSPAPTWSASCRAGSTSPPTTPRTAASTAPPSARSRPCSTCSPTPTSSPRARAASCSTPPGPSTPSLRRTRWPPPPGPRPTAPARPAPSARPSSRSMAASATPGSAWPTSSSAGHCSRATSSAGWGPTSTRCWRHHGIGSSDGLR